MTETKVCRACRIKKPIGDFSPHSKSGRRHDCKACQARRAQIKRQKDGPRPMACSGCGISTRRHRMCANCRIANQERIEADAPPLGPAPHICGLSTVAGWCPEVLRHGYDFLGRATMECPVHGVRFVPVIRPLDFVRYDQRARLDAELSAKQDRVEAPVEARYQDASRGRTAISRSKSGNFSVIGRDRQREIEAA